MRFIKATILELASSRQEFFHALRLIGLRIEYRQNIPIGINDNGIVIYWRKLGITPEDFRNLDQRQDLLMLQKRIEHLEQNQQSRNLKQQIEPKNRLKR